MAFPTTSVLTTFTGADEDPLSEGGNWSGPIRAARGRGVRNTNQRRPGATGNATKQDYWTPATFTDTEVFYTLVNKPASGYVDLIARISSPNTATPTMYELEITIAAGTDTWELYQISAGTGTLINTFTATELAAGDQVGMEVLGTGATVTINAWHKPSAGAWTLIGTYADTSANRITSAGYIGIESNQSLQQIDDFGGGEVVSTVTGLQYKRLSGPEQLTTSAATIYTVPTGKRARILHTHASNPTGSLVDLTMSIGTDAAGTRVLDGYPTRVDRVWDDFTPYDLAAGETLQAFAGTGSALVLTVTGYEV